MKELPFKERMRLMTEEHEFEMKNIDQEARIDDKRFPIQLASIFLGVVIPYSINCYIQYNYPKYWMNHGYIPLVTVASMCAIFYIGHCIARKIYK